MRFKDILVHLDGSSQAATRLQIAADLAWRHDAHLTGLCIADPPAPPPRLAGGEAPPSAWPVRRQDAARTEALFRDTLRHEGLAGAWCLVDPACPDAFAMRARIADLVVLGQPNPACTRAHGSALVEQALFGSGRPVLVVPHGGRMRSIGHEILLGWDGGPGAARAVHDALPLLGRAASVSVLTVDTDTGPDGAGITAHLARHGMAATLERVAARGAATGDVLLARAAGLMADLIVVGASRRTRLGVRDLGGVTRTLLRRMAVPVMMSC